MKYYGIYYNNEYKVTKRKTTMVNNREWLKINYGRNAKAYTEITFLEYIILKILGKAINAAVS